MKDNIKINPFEGLDLSEVSKESKLYLKELTDYFRKEGIDVEHFASNMGKLNKNLEDYILEYNNTINDNEQDNKYTCNDGVIESHYCPYKIELNGEYEACNCCSYCEEQCSNEI